MTKVLYSKQNMEPASKDKCEMKFKKRKQKPSECTSKKSKLLPEPEVENSDNSDDETIREPTTEQLKESEKVKYLFNVKSGRTKKKEKHIKKLEEQKNDSVLKDVQKNEEYLNKWNTNRETWKFEKLRQISIQSSIFNNEKIVDEIWPIALEYLASSKGQSKAKLIEYAEKQIEDIDNEITNTNNTELVKSYKYIRAREILQSFD